MTTTQTVIEPETTSKPYQGLRPFQEADQWSFCGRKTHVAEVLQRLYDHRFVAVVGLSGSGKSSLVRAGVIPELRADRLKDTSSDWLICMMTPEATPRRNLSEQLRLAVIEYFGENSLSKGDELDHWLANVNMLVESGSFGLSKAIKAAGLPERTRVLLVVDQFEELFRYSQRDVQDEAEWFVQQLLNVTWKPDDKVNETSEPANKVYVAITMRSEFLGACARYTGFAEAVNKGLYLTPRLNRKQLEEAITSPAEKCGREIAPKLVRRLLNDVANDQDQLPVLQHALMRCWEQGAKIVDDKIYEYEGGSNALNKHAEDLWKALNDQDKKNGRVIEALFRRITKPAGQEGNPESEKDGMRDAARLDIVCAQTGVERSRLVEIITWLRSATIAFLRDDKKAFRDESMIDITHESLIRKWSRLQRWIREESKSGEEYRRLVKLALHYENDQSEQFLLRQGEVREFLSYKRMNRWNDAWSLRYGGRYDLVEEFLRKSRLEHRKKRLEKASLEKKALRKKIGSAFAGVCVFAICLVAAASIRGLASNYETSIMEVSTRLVQDQGIGTETLRTRAQNTLAANILQPGRSIFFEPHLWQQFSALTLPGEASFPADTMIPDEASDNNLLGPVGQPARLAISKHGKYLAFSGVGQPLTLFHCHSNLKKPIILDQPASYEIKALVFSPDEKYLAAGNSDGKVRIYLLSNYPEDRNITLSTMSEIQTTAAGQSIRKPGQNFALAFSSDSKFLAIATEQNSTILMVELKINPAVPAGSKRYLSTISVDSRRYLINETITSLGFSPDGKFLLAGFENDSKFRLFQYDYDQRKLLFSKAVSINSNRRGIHFISAFAFGGPSSDLLAISDKDGDLILYSVPTLKKLKESSQPLTGSGVSLAFSPDGRYLAAGSASGQVWVFEAMESTDGWNPISSVFVMGRVNALAFDKTSRYVGIAVDDGTAQVIEAFTGEEVSHVDRVSTKGPSAIAIVFGDKNWVAYATSLPSVKAFEAKKDSPLSFGRVWGLVPCEMGPMSMSSKGTQWMYSCKNILYVERIGSQNGEASIVVKLNEPYRFHALALSGDGHYLAWIEQSPTNGETFFYLKNLDNGHVSEAKSCAKKNARTADIGLADAIALNYSGTIFACGSSGEVSLFQIRDSVKDVVVADDGVLPNISGFGISALAFSSTGSLAIGTQDSRVIVYRSLEDKDPVELQSSELKRDKWSTITALAFSPDGKSLMAAQSQVVTKPPAVFFKDMSPKSGVKIWLHKTPLSIAFSHEKINEKPYENTYIVALADSNQVKLFQVEDLKKFDPSGKGETIPKATLDFKGQIAALAFDEFDRSLIVSTIAYRDLIGVKQYRYLKQDLLTGVCDLLPPSEREYTRDSWAKQHVLMVNWLRLKPPSSLCGRKDLRH